MACLTTAKTTKEHEGILLQFEGKATHEELKLMKQHRNLCRQLCNIRRNMRNGFGHPNDYKRALDRVEQHQEKMMRSGISPEVVNAHYESHGRGIYNFNTIKI